MGQPVRVVDSRLIDDTRLRIEIDRSLTGMGHERYEAGHAPTGDRPTDLLAARLFDTGEVTALHAFSNVLTVTLARPGDDLVASVEQIVNTLFIHYRPGVKPTAIVP